MSPAAKIFPRASERGAHGKIFAAGLIGYAADGGSHPQ